MFIRLHPGIGNITACRFQTIRPLLRTLSSSSKSGLRDKQKIMTIDRELPNPRKGTYLRRLSLLGFFAIIGVSFSVITNYQKTQSPLITNTFYYMRRSPVVREMLGDGIQFDGLFPWVYGDMNQVAGKVNISFYVKGSKGRRGTVTMVAGREKQHQEFLIYEWGVTDGDKKINLLSETSVNSLRA